METFLNDYWPYIVAGIEFVISIVNWITVHHSEKVGWRKVALFILERLSILTSDNVWNGEAGIFKLPLTDIDPRKQRPGGLFILIPMLFILSVGCGTVPKQKARSAMDAVCSITPLAIEAWKATCELLSSGKKEKCLSALSKATLGANVILGIGQVTLGKCESTCAGGQCRNE